MSVPTSFPVIDFTAIGPGVGERFPEVVLPDQRGRTVDLHAARAGRRALVLFYRSARWWPFCKSQLVELQRAFADYERSDIAVFAISYDPVEALAAFAEKYGIGYTLLSDEGSEVIRRLGMLNEQVGEHHAFYGIPLREGVYGVPYPGAFLLDEQGVVLEKRFQSSYRERETGVGLLEEGFGEPSSQHGPEARASGEGLTVRAYLDSEHYRSMQRLQLVVELEIEPGLHVYGEPVPEGYVPLSIEVRPIEKLQVGPLTGPAPQPFTVEGLDEQFLVHAGRVRFSRPLTFLDRIGDPTIEVTVRYQACTATDCLMPAALRLELPIRVQNHVERDS